MDRDGFGVRLQKAMDDKGVTQADLVRLCGEIAPNVTINRSDISRYLAGKTSPRADKLVVLAKALDVPRNLLEGQSSGNSKLPPEVSLGLDCLCEASRCPSIYAHVTDGDAYVVYVSRPPDGDLNAAMSFFSAAGGALQDAGTAELAARVMRAIRAGGVEKEILERLFPAADGAERKKVSYSTDGLPTCPPEDAADVAQRQVRRVIRMRKRVQEHKKSGE